MWQLIFDWLADHVFVYDPAGPLNDYAVAIDAFLFLASLAVLVIVFGAIIGVCLAFIRRMFEAAGFDI